MLALDVGAGRWFYKLVERRRIMQTHFENFDDGAINVLHRNIVASTGAILLPAHVRTGIKSKLPPLPVNIIMVPSRPGLPQWPRPESRTGLGLERAGAILGSRDLRIA